MKPKGEVNILSLIFKLGMTVTMLHSDRLTDQLLNKTMKLTN